MIFKGYHWRGPDSIYTEERGKKPPKIVNTNDDFIEDCIFFVSFRKKDWYPEHLNIKGVTQEITFECKKVYFALTFKEYFFSFDEDNDSVLYRLNKKSLFLKSQGYDLVIRADDPLELSEGFLLDPSKSVIKIEISIQT